MKDYDKNYFWTATDPATLETKYYFKLNGMMVEVTKEVYQVCFNSYRKSLRDLERDEDRIQSLDYMETDNHSLHDIIPSASNTAEDAYHNLQRDELYTGIQKLNDEEKQIIMEILLEEKSIRQIAAERNIPYMTMKRKKDNILKKLKNLIKKW